MSLRQIKDKAFAGIIQPAIIAFDQSTTADLVNAPSGSLLA